jgi:hypothetical protein
MLAKDRIKRTEQLLGFFHLWYCADSPRLPPADTIPVAIPFLDENHCVAKINAGIERPELANPKAIPCTTITCQYFVQMLSMQTEKTKRTLKGAMIFRGP